MVGHTVNFEAVRKAVEILDDCVGTVVDRVLALGGRILLTADHGNSDQMIDYETGLVRTSHSTHPVECVYISSDAGQFSMPDRGILPDIGPTVLSLMGLPIPKGMTARNLLTPRNNS